ncbi:MAG: phosphoglucomutase/phosphomannomutase family protein [Actinobacteria bacterium]|nr:MAG: phosphoglucomutase/phosphomannomutase family protein [Actinomycetota bacterium]
MFTFGTDGYRGIIAKDFDFKVVGKLTQALVKSLKEKKSNPYLLIGYDTRFMSDKFASYAAQIALDSGAKTEITKNFIPTPILSYAVTDRKADAGIVITASHNPFYYNGFKIKNENGCSATPEQIESLKPYLEEKMDLPTFNFHSKPGCEIFEPKKSYYKHINKIVKKDKLKETGLKVVVDPMYGAGRTYFKELLESYNLDVCEIHNQSNPAFGGLHPEPINEQLDDLRNAVLEQKADIGLALDGDADRSGVIDDKGNFVNSHQIFALLLFHLFENKKKKGLVVKTYSTTSLVDIMAESYGLEIKQTPIGFKHISNLMLTEDVLIGGEESGGIGLKGHIPERDGLLIGLMLIELMVETGKHISELINDLDKRFGTFAYGRVDKITRPETKAMFYQTLESKNVPSTVNKKLRRLLNKDGYKFEFEDRSWLMFRLSGTESVVRIYAEASDPDEVKKLLIEGERLVNQLTTS